MSSFYNAEGKPVLFAIVKAIQENKAYLGEVDGLIGDGDHGMNMNKGFSLFEKRFMDKEFTFSEGLEQLGTILFSEIGGSMGPIYGTILCDAGETGHQFEEIGVAQLSQMLRAGLTGLQEVVDAEVGDKTLVDTLSPAIESLELSNLKGENLPEALENMTRAATRGRDSTKDLVAKFGRSSRLGERSRGVLDAGATSCCIILTAMADAITELTLCEV